MPVSSSYVTNTNSVVSLLYVSRLIITPSNARSVLHRPSSRGHQARATAQALARVREEGESPLSSPSAPRPPQPGLRWWPPRGGPRGGSASVLTGKTSCCLSVGVSVLPVTRPFVLVSAASRLTLLVTVFPPPPRPPGVHSACVRVHRHSSSGSQVPPTYPHLDALPVPQTPALYTKPASCQPPTPTRDSAVSLFHSLVIRSGVRM